MDEKLTKIIDENIRPMLQKDGGDLEIISYEGNTLKISYQGACGCCPHAAIGTLKFIESVLKDQYNSDIIVEKA
ncbi:MAG: NifU family protein [Candidatus Zapsychrus exili]|nr:NifU family protein [Candidatus Zapsychrus exili]